MDTIQFAVAERELGMGVFVCAEPVINGEPLLAALAREGEEGFAGLRPADLAGQLQPPTTTPVKVFGCECGDYGCSYVRLDVEVREEEVVWENIHTSNTSSPLPVGPFRFSRKDYERALAEATIHKPRPARPRGPGR